MADYTNNSQQRILAVVLALFDDVVNGVAPVALARAVATSLPNITRDLANLQAAGLAERLEETGCWRLTPRLPQQAIKVFTAIDRAEQALSQARQRFTRTPG